MARAAVQDSSAEVGPYPAHLHSGTCDTLGEVIFPLNDAAAPDGDVAGTSPTLTVAASETTTEAPLADLLAAPHAINVHMSADDMGTYVACGDLGGIVVEGELVIGMAELNESGLSGIAVLREAGAATDVTFYLSRATTAGTPAPPAGSPAAGGASPAAEADMTVEIMGFAYRDAMLEVPVGTTVRWVNNDTVPHTVTSTPGGDVFQSGKMSKGDEYTFTFTEPGTYEYFCEYHGNMKGTVIVS